MSFSSFLRCSLRLCVVAVCVVGPLVPATPAHAASRLKDVVDFEGVRDAC